MPAAKKAALSLAAALVLSLAACGDGPDGRDEDSAAAAEERKREAQALGRDTDETVFDDMLQTQDKARGVEDLTLGRKDQLDEALQNSEADDAGE